MSLMTIERPSTSTHPNLRIRVRELFDEANTISKTFGENPSNPNLHLQKIAEKFLPDENLRRLERQLPPHWLSLHRWVGGVKKRSSLILALTYRTGYKRLDQTIIASTSEHVKGIRVCGEHIEHHSLPHYADQLQAKLEELIGYFVHTCTRH